MATEFKLPELGENIETGDLVRLMIKPGASIAEGDPVMELETDKAVVEVPSSVTGTIDEIRVKEGDKLKVGQVIFTVENGAGTKPAAKTEKPAAPPRTNSSAKPSLTAAPPRERPFPKASRSWNSKQTKPSSKFPPRSAE
jgi:pyruvate dehydrogenase E2 component (dihydrolipoamide acetyltransferase)